MKKVMCSSGIENHMKLHAGKTHSVWGKKEAGIANYVKVLYQFIMCILLI